MKCKRCGKEVAENVSICDNCGFDLDEYRSLTKIIVEEDPEVELSKKSGLIDSPILAFIFGLLSVLSSLTFVVLWSFQGIVIVLLAFVLLFNFLTFKLANKPAKIKLKPFSNVGKAMAYFSIGYIILKIVFDLLKPLF